MSKRKFNSIKRTVKTLYVIAVIVIGVWQLSKSPAAESGALPPAGTSPAASVLQQISVKGRAPKTGYSRSLFSDGWGNIGGCDVRNFILARDMTNVRFVIDTCKISSGLLNDPYTGTQISFLRGATTSDDVQIDHVVSLGDAWQKGAQALNSIERYALANDPLNLLAVDGAANQNKGDSDAASWLPPNKSFRCNYVARQIGVKHKYNLWVTMAEYQAMAGVLINCPDQKVPDTLSLALRSHEETPAQLVPLWSSPLSLTELPSQPAADEPSDLNPQN